MEKILVSIHDAKADTWTPPHTVDSKAAAIREFGMLVNDRQQTMISEHPADFDLFQVGTWDCVAGLVDGLNGGKNPMAIHIANGVDVKVAADAKA